MDDYEDGCFAWRYPDLTEHVLYYARVIDHMIRYGMADEARELATLRLAQESLKGVIEMPSQDADRIIRSIKQNDWRVSGKLRVEYPRLEDEPKEQRVVEAVRTAFEDNSAKPSGNALT